VLLDGTRGEMAEEAERFAQRARKQIGLPVEMVTNGLTSLGSGAAARESLAEVPRRNQKRKKIEAEKPDGGFGAAAVILREYLASRTPRIVRR